MRVIRATRRVSARALAEAARVLREGGVVAFPTETSYGLAADPSNAKAVRKIYTIKGRPKKKPLPLVAATFAAASRTFVFSKRMSRLAKKHWPGSLTLVLPLRKGIRLAATAGEKTADKRTAAVRVPSSPWARAIAAVAGGLATSTSANVSGESATHDPRALQRAFAGRRARPDLLIDIGRLPKRAASSIIGEKGGRLIVLREGVISKNIHAR